MKKEKEVQTNTEETVENKTPIETLESAEEKDSKKEKKSKKRKEKAPKTKKASKPKKAKKAKPIKNRTRWTKKYFKKYHGKLNTSFYDAIQSDYDKAVERAIKLSSLTKDDFDQPVIITIPDSYNNKDQVLYRLDQKADGTFTQIYDQALVTLLFFGAETLHYYQANIDHRTGHIGFDVSGEFNYFDVVRIQTELKYDNLDKPKYLMLDIEIGLSDGTTVPLHLRNHRLHQGYEPSEILTNDEQKVLDLLKRKIRSEKSV